MKINNPLNPPLLRGTLNFLNPPLLRGTLTRTIMIFLSISLMLAGAFTPAPATPISDRRIVESEIIFDRVIEPYIQDKFKENISDEYLIVQRNLLKVNLYRVETIDGRDVYSVHIDFVVRMKERESGLEYTTLRGQETLFIIERGKIKDIVPFTEYITEHAHMDTDKKINN